MVLTTLLAALAFAQAYARDISARTDFRFAQRDERKISLRMGNASLTDVFAKLPKVDYAVDADAFKGRRITLYLTDVTTTEALNAVAAALDAHWETVGGVKVLKKGAGFGLNGTAFRSFSAPSMPKELFRQYGNGLQGMSPEEREEVQKSLNEAPKVTPSMPDLRIQVQKAFEDARKEMRSQRTLKNDEERAAYDKAQTEIETRRKAVEDARKEGKAAWGPERFSGSFDALMKSLTPAQKTLHKSRGYLKVSDLTLEQRKMADIAEDGTIEMTVSRDGETIRIKNG